MPKELRPAFWFKFITFVFLFWSLSLSAEPFYTYRWTSLTSVKDLLRAGNYNGDINQIGETLSNGEYAVLNEAVFKVLAEWNKYGKHIAGTGLYQSDRSIDTIKWGYDSPILLVVQDSGNSRRNYLHNAYVNSFPSEKVSMRPITYEDIDIIWRNILRQRGLQNQYWQMNEYNMAVLKAHRLGNWPKSTVLFLEAMAFNHIQKFVYEEMLTKTNPSAELIQLLESTSVLFFLKWDEICNLSV